jgi:hypothetical protein
VIVVNNNPDPNPHAINSIQKLNDGTIVAYDRSGEQVTPAPTQIEHNGVVVTLLSEKGAGIFIMNNNDGSTLQMNDNGNVHKHDGEDFGDLLIDFKMPELNPKERPAIEQRTEQQPARSGGHIR